MKNIEESLLQNGSQPVHIPGDKLFHIFPFHVSFHLPGLRFWNPPGRDPDPGTDIEQNTAVAVRPHRLADRLAKRHQEGVDPDPVLPRELFPQGRLRLQGVLVVT
jgi:hypothetical protein